MGKRYTETDRRDSFQDNAAERGVRDDVKRRRRHKTSVWLLFGVGILILLLLAPKFTNYSYHVQSIKFKDQIQGFLHSW